MKRTQIFLAAALAATSATGFAASGPEPVAEALSYRAYIGGLPLGTLNLKIAMDESRYATEARFDMTSFLRAVLDTDARASASGALNSGEAVPQKFDYWVRDGKKTRTSEMLFDQSGNPQEVIASPPFRVKPYDMDIDQATGAVDPATAVVLLSAPRAEACALNLTVYDGRKLHGITLRPAQNKAKDATRFYCEGRYERLAGFKAKYMAPDVRAYDFQAELVQIAPDRWRPKRVSAKTKFGTAIAVLQ